MWCVDVGEPGGRGRDGTYSNFEVDALVRHGAHAVVEAEGILAHVVSGEDEIALPLFLAVDDGVVARSADAVVNIEGAACLHLVREEVLVQVDEEAAWPIDAAVSWKGAYCKVEGHLYAFLFNPCVET